MKMTATEIEILVRSTEIDVNGHVNNAKFLEYLEWGREDWYEKCGLYYDVLKELGIVTVVVHVVADYLREAVQNDKLRIQTNLKSIGNTSFVMDQSIRNQGDELVLTAEFVIVTVHPETHVKTRVPDVIRNELEPSPAD
jgi:thioesterase III